LHIEKVNERTFREKKKNINFHEKGVEKNPRKKNMKEFCARGGERNKKIIQCFAAEIFQKRLQPMNFYSVFSCKKANIGEILLTAGFMVADGLSKTSWPLHVTTRITYQNNKIQKKKNV